MPGVPPNTFENLKAKIKGIFKSKKSEKPAADKKEEAAKPTEATTNGVAPTETTPAEPAPAAAASEPAAAKVEETPAAPAGEPVKAEEPAAPVEAPKVEETPAVEPTAVTA